MRLRLILFFRIFAFCIHFCSSKATDPVSDVILPLGRVVNAITFQKKLNGDQGLATKIIGELLNFDKKVFVDIVDTNLKEQVSQLSEVSKYIENIPSVDAKKIDKTINALKALTEAKSDESRLNEKSFEKPTKLLESSAKLENELINIQQRDLDKTRFEDIENILKEMENAEGKDVDQKNLKTWLTTLNEKGELCKAALLRIVDYKNVYAAFYEFEGLSGQTLPFLNVSRSIATVSRNFGDIAQFDSAVSDLTEQSSALRSAKSSFENFLVLFKKVDKSMKLAQNMATPRLSGKQFTTGFPNGAQDLNELLGDKLADRYLKLLTNGQSTDVIKDSLTPLLKLGIALDEAHNETMKLVVNPQVLADYDKYQVIFSNFSSATQQATQNEDLEKGLKTIASCVKFLKKDDKLPNFNQLETIRNHVANIEKKLKEFDAVMMEINKNEGFGTFQTEFQLLIEQLGKLGRGADQSKQITVWDSIRKMDFHKKHLVIFNTIQKLDLNPFQLGGDGLPVSILKETLESAKRSNLFDALKCLPTSSPDIAQLIESGKKVNELKSEKTKLTAVTQIVSTALNIQTKANKAVAELRKSTKEEGARRIHSELSIDDIKRIDKFLAITSLLNDADMIRRSDSSISKVISPVDPVKQAADQVQGAGFYNNEFRKSMNELVIGVKGLFKTISTMPSKTLKDALKVFDNLSKLKGHSLKDVHKLSDPIAKVLFKNADPKIKGAAKDFESVGALRMDFASFSAVPNLEKELMDFFEPFLAVGGESTTVEEGFWEGTWGKILLGFFALLGLILIIAIIYLVVRCYKNRKNKTSNSTDDIEKGKITKGWKKSKKKIGSDKKKKSTRSHTASTTPAQISLGSTTPVQNNNRTPTPSATPSHSYQNLTTPAQSSLGTTPRHPSPGPEALTPDTTKYTSADMKIKRTEKKDGIIGWFRNLFTKKQATRTEVRPTRTLPPATQPPRPAQPLRPPPTSTDRKKGKTNEIQPEKSLEKSAYSELEPRGEHPDIILLRKHRAGLPERERKHKSDTSSSKFQKKGPIHIPREPIIPPTAAVLPENGFTGKVTYNPKDNEMYETGSDVDDIELDESVRIEDLSTIESMKKSKKSKKKTVEKPKTLDGEQKNDADDKDPTGGIGGTPLKA